MVETVKRSDFVGPQGPQGVPGPRGEAGERGLDGRDGRDGRDGKDGTAGHSPRHQWEGTMLRLEQGAPGEWGPWVDLQGMPGQDGLTPADGTPGEQGPEGPMGMQGEPGVMPNHQWDGTSIRFETAPGEWGQWVNLVGQTGPGIQGVHHPEQHKNLTMLQPVPGDDIVFFYTRKELKIEEVRSVIRGNLASWEMRFGDERNELGELITTTTTTSNTKGDVSVVTQDHVAPGSFIWVEIESTIGSPDELQIYLVYKEL